MKIKKYNLDFGGKEMTFEFSDLCANAESSVLVSLGETKVQVVVAKGQESTKDYFPLKVDYQEKFYATGEILGSKYNKREGRPSTEAVLSARVIDRTIRPFFDKHIKNDVHVVANVLSLGEYDPDVLATNGAIVALMSSSLNWFGPASALRVVKKENGELEINPKYSEYKDKKEVTDTFLSLRNEKVVMIENESLNLQESEFLEIVKKGLEESKKVEDFFASMCEEVRGENKIEKDIPEQKDFSEIQNLFEKEFVETLEENFSEILNNDFTESLKKDFAKKVSESEFEKKYSFGEVSEVFEKGVKKIVRKNILEKEQRLDGRKIDEVRSLFAKAGDFSKQIHGSGIFYRGQTRVMSFVTLGDLKDALFINGMEVNGVKNFIHHYNFPPYSVGEAGRLGSPSRREIGHGNLAEKAQRRVVPSTDEFPYTVRVVSEIMSSNGSTSMASVCGTTLALLDAGVPVSEKVAGIAVGLIEESEDNFKVLTDIVGKEDFYGDMDFKVAGSKNGITAIQLDLKNNGLNLEIIENVLERAKKARLEILEVIESEISEPNSLPENVEIVKKITIPVSKIGVVIGKGGSVINNVTKESGAKVDIKRDGNVFIYGSSEQTEKAKNMIEGIVGAFEK